MKSENICSNAILCFPDGMKININDLNGFKFKLSIIKKIIYRIKLRWNLRKRYIKFECKISKDK